MTRLLVCHKARDEHLETADLRSIIFTVTELDLPSTGRHRALLTHEIGNCRFIASVRSHLLWPSTERSGDQSYIEAFVKDRFPCQNACLESGEEENTTGPHYG